MIAEHISTPTSGPWVNGYGEGLTGPTTPAEPTVAEAVAMNEWFEDTTVEYPKIQHVVVSCGMETIAIIPLNGVGGETTGKDHARLIAAAPGLLLACVAAEPLLGVSTPQYNTKYTARRNARNLIRAALNKAKS